MIEFHQLSHFTQGYIEAIFFTEGEELEGKTFIDFSPALVKRIIEDCAGFDMLNSKHLDATGATSAQNGHDFWLTRNHHGAGFWDRGYKGSLGERLTIAAQKYPEFNIYVSKSGKVHGE